ncbi:MAG: beta-N-acetylhexosaminidase [Pseudomonadota bacterium]
MSRAFVCGCAGTALTPDERAFLRASDPFGLILFKRNVETPAQVRALIADFRAVVGRAAAVLVDQEGGRVQRLGPPHWRAYPAAARLGALDLPLPRRAEVVRRAATLLGQDLRDLGITIDCAPVLDVPVAGAHDVIGDRAFSQRAEAVTQLGRAAALGLADAGVMPVIKHIPGHGRAGVDSHLDLPVVDAPLDLLGESDFQPFAANRDLPAAMTAHVVYTALDPERPATQSPIVIRFIRDEIGFGGLLFSDDLSMQALHGTLQARTEAAFAAGVDLALHCNGDLAEAEAVANAAPTLAGLALTRAERAATWRGETAARFDPVEAWAEIEASLAIKA